MDFSINFYKNIFALIDRNIRSYKVKFQAWIKHPSAISNKDMFTRFEYNFVEQNFKSNKEKISPKKIRKYLTRCTISLRSRLYWNLLEIENELSQIYVVFPHVESPTTASLRECNSFTIGHGTEQAIRKGPWYTDRKRIQRKSASLRRLPGPRRPLRSVEEGLEHQGHEHRGVSTPATGSFEAGFHSS